jgi:hypothetical protein
MTGTGVLTNDRRLRLRWAPTGHLFPVSTLEHKP